MQFKGKSIGGVLAMSVDDAVEFFSAHASIHHALRLLQEPGFFDRLGAATKGLTGGLSAAARAHGVTFSAQAVGGMFGLYFRAAPPASYAEVMECDKEAFNRFFHAMLKEGVYLAPSAFEAGFVSAAHSEAEIAATIAAAERVFAAGATRPA